MLIQTEEQFTELLQEIVNQPRLAVDTEYNKNRPWDQTRIMGVSLCWEYGGTFQSYYLPFRHVFGGLNFGEVNLPIEWLKTLGEAIGREDLLTDWWNAKGDMKQFRKDGIEIKGPIRDGMVFSHMVCEWGTHRLKVFSDQVFGTDSSFEQKKLKEIEKSIGSWEQIPPVVMGKYAEKDAILTWRCVDHLLPLLKKQELDHLIDDQMGTLRALLDIEYRGLKIRRSVAQKLSQQAEARLEVLRAELGYDCMTDQLIRRLYSSPPEGLGFVPVEFGKPSKSFPKGKPSTGRSVLARYSHPEIPIVLETRSLVKANSTWFRGFLDVADKDDRVHTDFWQHGTVTSRLTSRRPNLHQLPRMKEEEVEQGVTQKLVKTMLDVTDGYELWEADYSQQEFRLAGVYGQEESILEAYRSGSDMHQLTAELMRIERQDAKMVNFLTIYGGGPNKLKDALGITFREAKEFLDEFWIKYPKLARFVEAASNAAATRGWVKYWNGIKRHPRFVSEHHKMANSIIQGGCAQMMFRSMRNIHQAQLPSHMVSQVHDSIWVEVPKDDVETQLKQIKYHMEDWTLEQFDLLFAVDLKRLA